ncbi:conserved hypothetical protein [uncultured Stenotrophomonas sp.]|uniref:site-specific DNA-methyltransferase (adenine-specific) n=1 Tax=uncultured Stenotrophomonas sp. TaxID=165438 RepID=A0A1Y5Q5Z5_9GAMM|nr:conserved hypothetical protein [uncultured Stenotrophomonas sp.]
MNDPATNADFEQAHKRIRELIDRFEKHAAAYMQPTYQEAEARKDFIDPMFKALGWDVDHEREHNPYEQEVKVERGVTVAKAQKRADYAFHLCPNFRDVRFFVEAKKPSVNLERDADAHFQTIRYGYSAGTPLAVLTDFEQIRVLDCRRRPHPDSVLDQVYKGWRYTDFRDTAKFAEFYWLFSREAHADGSYQRRIEELPKPKGGAKQRGLFKGGYQPVGDSFLEELSEYRETLAKTFKKAEESLDSAALTELVQRTLDRLVFLRFLEDKQIETEIRVTDFGKGKNAWADFQSASRRLDNIYNGIVFKRLPHLDDAGFDVDEDVFGDICERLSAENSPYNFDAIPIHILGSIYERFLGSVIRATDKRAKVEEKPEVRKSGGVYYTPEYIVRYIVAQTVGKQIEGKTPAEIAKLRFADIACGSGSFLLGVYDELLHYHADWYNRPEHAKQAKRDGCVQTEDGTWRLSLAQRRNILQNNIYGVDIDRQAVEVAQLSLFLKLLEDERATSARQYQLDYARDANMKKLLPDLSGNIVCGNSLIGWDIAGMAGLSAEEKLRLNPLDFRDEFPIVMREGGFDAVVGNPPYVLLQDEFRDPTSYDYLKSHYTVASFKLDTYHLFFERAGRVLRANGRLGYITPSNFLTNNHLDGLRRFLLSQVRIERIVVFEGKVFAGAQVDTAIALCINNDLMDYFDMLRVSAKPPVSFDVPAIALKHSDCLERHLALITPPTATGVAALLTAVDERSTPLGELFGVSFGKQLRDREKFPTDVIQVESLSKIPKTHRPCYTGRDVGRYALSWSGLACLRSREAKRGGCWDDAVHGAAPKLITRQIGMVPVFGWDAVGYHCLNTVFMLTPKTASVSAVYVLGLLNSKLLVTYWKNRFYDQRERFPKIKGAYLKQLPIYVPCLTNERDRSRYDHLVVLVEQMLEAKERQTDADEHMAEIAARECTALDRQIDTLVYELYGLTDAEIALVENGT